MKKRIVFITGTRADYGKIKPLIKKIYNNPFFDVNIFVTGMHLLNQYGYTYNEIAKDFKRNLYKFSNTKSSKENYLETFQTTLKLFSNFLEIKKIDAVVIHGDRVESLAAATCSFLKQIKILHIEGGEVSGNIDESIRHSISKMANTHFVSNTEAYRRLYQMGENKNSIHIIGSPETDLIFSNKLPAIDDVCKRYEINFKNYSVVILHPFIDKITEYKKKVSLFFETINYSNQNFVIIYPNNDVGSKIIIKEILKLKKNKKIKILKSMRFEYYLALLKNAYFIIGNSSSGVREASNYNIPCLNIGKRQHNRSKSKNIINIKFNQDDIFRQIKKYSIKKKLNLNKEKKFFGSGKSADKFAKIIIKKTFWKKNNQKYFNDVI